MSVSGSRSPQKITNRKMREDVEETDSAKDEIRVRHKEREKEIVTP